MALAWHRHGTGAALTLIHWHQGSSNLPTPSIGDLELKVGLNATLVWTMTTCAPGEGGDISQSLNGQ